MQTYFCSALVAVGGGGGGCTDACCVGGVGGAGSATPLIPSLKPFNPSPSPLPSSGSRFAPKSRNATTASTIRCHGCNKSPHLYPPRASSCRLAIHTILSHKPTNGGDGRHLRFSGQTHIPGHRRAEPSKLGRIFKKQACRRMSFFPSTAPFGHVGMRSWRIRRSIHSDVNRAILVITYRIL